MKRQTAAVLTRRRAPVGAVASGMTLGAGAAMAQSAAGCDSADNPLCPHALYLSRQHNRVHGTGDTGNTGRKSSDGCIGLYNEQVKELVGLAKVGTQVNLF